MNGAFPSALGLGWGWFAQVHGQGRSVFPTSRRGSGLRRQKVAVSPPLWTGGRIRSIAARMSPKSTSSGTRTRPSSPTTSLSARPRRPRRLGGDAFAEVLADLAGDPALGRGEHQRDDAHGSRRPPTRSRSIDTMTRLPSDAGLPVVHPGIHRRATPAVLVLIPPCDRPQGTKIGGPQEPAPEARR
jgi:hypothetical protein